MEGRSFIPIEQYPITKLHSFRQQCMNHFSPLTKHHFPIPNTIRNCPSSSKPVVSFTSTAHQVPITPNKRLLNNWKRCFVRPASRTESSIWSFLKVNIFTAHVYSFCASPASSVGPGLVRCGAVPLHWKTFHQAKPYLAVWGFGFETSNLKLHSRQWNLHAATITAPVRLRDLLKFQSQVVLKLFIRFFLSALRG